MYPIARPALLTGLLLITAGCGKDRSPAAPAAPVTKPAQVALPDPVSEEDAAAPVTIEPPGEPIPRGPKGISKTAYDAIAKQIWAADREAPRVWEESKKHYDFEGLGPLIGTALNEVHVPEHSCYILGRLVGRPDVVAHLRMDTGDAGDAAGQELALSLQASSQSLSNFATVGRSTLERSADEMRMSWNVDCVGQLDIPRTAYVGGASKSSFYTVVNDGHLLRVHGDIEMGFARKIRDALDANPKVQTVALGSGGGFVHEAIQAGMLIRTRGLDTTLFGDCYSACPLVFMAGVNRQIWSPYPKLGFHQAYSYDGPSPPLSQVYQLIWQYSLAMGTDPRFVVPMMWSAAPQDMNRVAGDDERLCRSRMATWVQRGCTAD